jgi:hypothetical protein
MVDRVDFGFGVMFINLILHTFTLRLIFLLACRRISVLLFTIFIFSPNKLALCA